MKTEEPRPGSLWRHKNGNLYKVLAMANHPTERQETYPRSVVYENVHNGNFYCRNFTDWHRSMTEVSELVPLGPNRTRGGHEAIVHTIDGPSPGMPVVASFKGFGGWQMDYWPADGKHSREKVYDLIGHLPPEPPKPREVWLHTNFADEGKYHPVHMKPSEGLIHFREVLPDTGLTDAEKGYLRSILLVNAEEPNDRRAKGIMEKLGNLGLLPP